MATPAKRGVTGRAPSPRSPAARRGLIALLLAGFVLASVGVILRRTYGLRRADELKALRAKRDSLSGARVQLEDDIREAKSRARLQPIAEQRLNMRIPTPDQTILLPRPRGKRAP